MKIILPVDSRVTDTQGFIVLDTATGALAAHATAESLPFHRRGFRGGFRLGARLCVCNSFSIKIYDVEDGDASGLGFRFAQQIFRPEWLVGRGANADLHMVTPSADGRHLLLANSYMDCVDTLSESGELVRRDHLWSLSDEVRSMVPARHAAAADLCHLNHIELLQGQRLLTLGNLNGTQQGAILHWESGRILLRGLARPHDGVWSQGQYIVSETGKCCLSIFEDVESVADLDRAPVRTVALDDGLENLHQKHWARGVLAVDDHLFVGASQFQDRLDADPNLPPSHLIVLDRRTLRILDRLWIPTVGELVKPVIYSLIPWHRADGAQAR